jgi:hypothetical protein
MAKRWSFGRCCTTIIDITHFALTAATVTDLLSMYDVEMLAVKRLAVYTLLYPPTMRIEAI